VPSTAATFGASIASVVDRLRSTLYGARARWVRSVGEASGSQQTAVGRQLFNTVLAAHRGSRVNSYRDRQTSRQADIRMRTYGSTAVSDDSRVSVVDVSCGGALISDDDGEVDQTTTIKKSANMTERVPVPSSEHVAEIVGRQGTKTYARVCVELCGP